MLIRIVLFALILILSGCATRIHQYQYIHSKGRNCLRFATYNVYWQNSSSDKRNPESVIRIIKEINPDIMTLQETFCFSARHLEKVFRKSHPYQLFRDQHSNKSEDGLGILSKYPIVKNIYFPPKYGWFPGWIFVIKTPKGYLQVLNVHLNPPLVSEGNIGLFAEGLWLTPKFRFQEISYYCKYLNPCMSTIIAGDFNESDSGIACQFLRNRCYLDVLLNKIPSCIKTWYCRWGCFNFTGRYDRIYTSRDIDTVYTRVLQKGYSDHFPVVVDIK